MEDIVDDDVYHDSCDSSDDESGYDSDDDIYHDSNDGCDDSICDINSNHNNVRRLVVRNS